MRTTWKSLSNETRRGDSVELSRFVVSGDSKEMREKIRKVFFLFITFGLVVLMFGSASGQQAKNIIKLKKTGKELETKEMKTKPLTFILSLTFLSNHQGVCLWDLGTRLRISPT